MRVLHLNAGNETGGGMHHILLLLSHLNKDEVFLGVFEKGELSQRAEKLGIHTEVFPQTSRLDFSIVNQIANYVETHQIDIIHTHGARANLFGTFLKKKTDCLWVSTVHSDPRDDFLGQGIKGKVFTFLNIWSIKKANHLFAISERFREILSQEFHVNNNKITMILNGIEFNHRSTRPYNRKDLGLNEQDFTMIMVARLEKVKDHLTAFKGVKLASNKVPNLKLLLVGDGKERSELATQCQQMGLDNIVKFLGHRDDVADLYPIADLAMLTSRSESFPLVLLEAAREAIPVLTTDVGGVKKMIPSQEYGWIVDVSDYKSVATSIIEAAEYKPRNYLTEMGTRLQDYCRSNFSIDNQAEDVYQTYRKLLKK